MTSMKMTGYWASTAVVALVLLTGGAAEVVRWPEVVAGVVQLGYRPYFTTNARPCGSCSEV